eukprot:Em0001g1499a
MQCCPPPSAASSSSAAPTATSSRAAHTARAAAAAEAAGAPLQYWHQCPHHHFACCYPGRCHHHPHGSHGLNQAAEKRDGNSAPEGGPQASKTEVALSVVRSVGLHWSTSFMIDKKMSSEKVLSLSEMLCAEEEILICAKFAESSWSEEFLASLGPKDKEIGSDNSDVDEDNMYLEDTSENENI